MDWLQGLRARADQAPLAARDALHVAASAHAIGSIETALADRMAAAGLPIVAVSSGWCLTGTPANAAFARIAEWLRASELVLAAWVCSSPVATYAPPSVPGMDIGDTPSGVIW